MSLENFSVFEFGLKDEQYIMAFAYLIGMLQGHFDLDKEIVTKEQMTKYVLDSVDFAKGRSSTQ